MSRKPLAPNSTATGFTPGPGTAAYRERESRRRRAGTHRRRWRLYGMRTRLFAGFVAVALITTVIITTGSYFLIRDALLSRVATNADSQLIADVQQNGTALEQST